MSADMPDGTVVLFCQACRKFGLEGVERWIPAQGDWRETLRTLAGHAKEQRDVMQAVMETPISDPRWTDLS